MSYAYGANRPPAEALLHEVSRLRKINADLSRQCKQLEARVKDLLAVGEVETRQSVRDCGTHAGYVRHLRREEKACDPCKKARAIYQRNYRQQKAAAA